MKDKNEARDELISKFKERVDLFCEALKGDNNVYLSSQYAMLTKYLYELVEMSGQGFVKEHFEADRIQVKLSDVVASLSPGDKCILCVRLKDNKWRASKFYGNDEELEDILIDIIGDTLEELDSFNADGIDWIRDELLEQFDMK